MFSLCLPWHGNQEERIEWHNGDVQKPVMIQHYNVNMGGVDKCDQRLSYYGLNRKSKKWWKKVFFRFFEMSIVNMILFFAKYPEFRKRRNCHSKILIINACRWIGSTVPRRQSGAAVENRGRPSLEPASVSKVDVQAATRLTGKHYPSKNTQRWLAVARERTKQRFQN